MDDFALDFDEQHDPNGPFWSRDTVALRDLATILECGGFLRIEGYCLSYSEEVNPLDETWGYEITDMDGYTVKMFGPNLIDALVYIVTRILGGQSHNDEIPF